MTIQYQLRESFWTPYEQCKEHIGKKFTLIREIPVEETNDPELEGELFDIQFDEGEKFVAWYEEIYDKSCIVNGEVI